MYTLEMISVRMLVIMLNVYRLRLKLGTANWLLFLFMSADFFVLFSGWLAIFLLPRFSPLGQLSVLLILIITYSSSNLFLSSLIPIGFLLKYLVNGERLTAILSAFMSM